MAYLVGLQRSTFGDGVGVETGRTEVEPKLPHVDGVNPHQAKEILQG